MEVSKDAENSHNLAKIHVNTESATDKTEQQKDRVDMPPFTGTERSQSEKVEGEQTNLKWNPSSATGTGEEAKRAIQQANVEGNQQYYENGELYESSSYYYNGAGDMQDAPSLHYGGRGRGYSRGRGFSSRQQSWKKSSIPIMKRKKDDKPLSEPISDLNSWPTLDAAIKQASPTEERETKDTIIELPPKEDNPKEEGEQDPLSPGSDMSKKKGVNWVPFKDIGPPPRQLPSSRGRGGPRRRSTDVTRPPWRGESRGFRRGGRGAPRSYPMGQGAQQYGYPMMMVDGESLTEAILKQIEYYFSTDNLIKDVWLREQMDSEGWIPVSLLANFNRVKTLTTDPDEIMEVLSTSELVECKDNKFLRCRENWKIWLIPNSNKKHDVEEKKEEKKEENKEEKKEERKEEKKEDIKKEDIKKEDVKKEDIKKEEKKEEKPKQNAALHSEVPQQPKQEKQEDKPKQSDKKEPLKVVLAWGPEKKTITSEPAAQGVKKQEDKKQEEKKAAPESEKRPIQANHHSVDKRNYTSNHVEKKGVNNHKRVEKEAGKQGKDEKSEDKAIKTEDGEWETVTGKRRSNKLNNSPKEHANSR